MNVPDRFYYNLGDFFRDIEREQAEFQEQSTSADASKDSYDFGLAVGNFFRGVLDSTQNYDTAKRLTDTFILGAPHLEDDDNDIGAIFTPEDDEDF